MKVILERRSAIGAHSYGELNIADLEKVVRRLCLLCPAIAFALCSRTIMILVISNRSQLQSGRVMSLTGSVERAQPTRGHTAAALLRAVREGARG